MSKGYNEIKNYLHNELGLSKEYVLSVAKEYIEESIDKHVVSILNSNHVNRMINKKMGEILTGSHSSHKDLSADYIREEIQKEIKAEVFKRINFEKIDIKLQ